MLLILDNCEQVIAEAVEPAEVLLRNPGPRFTSSPQARERLGVGGEAVLALTSLAMPDD